MGFRRDLETVVLWVSSKTLVAARFLERGLHLLIEDIAEAFVKQKRKNELLVVTSVDGPAKKRGCSPEIGFELLLRDAAAHNSNPSRLRTATSRSSAANAALALSCRRF